VARRSAPPPADTHAIQRSNRHASPEQTYKPLYRRWFLRPHDARAVVWVSRDPGRKRVFRGPATSARGDRQPRAWKPWIRRHGASV